MSKAPTDVLVRADKTLEGWKAIQADLAFGALTQAEMQAGMERVGAIVTQINNLEAQLTDLRNQRDAAKSELWDQVKRVRSAVKGIYGDDASEYEVVGGTRRSERG